MKPPPKPLLAQRVLECKAALKRLEELVSTPAASSDDVVRAALALHVNAVLAFVAAEREHPQ